MWRTAHKFISWEKVSLALSSSLWPYPTMRSVEVVEYRWPPVDSGDGTRRAISDFFAGENETVKFVAC